MKKLLIASTVLCAVIGLGLGTAALGNGAVDGDEPGMMVSPQMIVLSKTSGVTVHTNIPYGSVDSGTVTLESLNGTAPALYVWDDDRGHLAARFRVADLALEPSDGTTLTLRGDYKVPGESFAAVDIVRVKD